MKAIKKWIASLLTMSLLVGIVVLPAEAANDFTVSVSGGTIDGKNGTFTSELSIANNPGLVDLTINVYYKYAILTCASDGVTADKTGGWSMVNKFNDSTLIPEEKASEGWKMASFGYVGDSDAPVTRNGVIGTITFSVTDDAENCTTELEVEVKKATATGEQNITADTVTQNSTITITGIVPMLSSVSLDQNAVTVEGGENEATTVQATAVSAKGTEITNGASWSVEPADGKVSVDANGLISVEAKAKAGTYTIKAAGKGNTSAGNAQTTLTVNRAAQTLTSVSLEPTSVEVAGGTSEAKTVTAKAIDQFDDEITENVNWEIENNSDATHVTIGNGTVSVGAVAKEGTYTVKATAGSGDPKTADLTVSRTDAVANTVTVRGTTTELIVPADNATEDAKSDAFTATVTDQFDETMSNPKVSWFIKDSEGKEVPGVTIADGIVTVTKAAQEAITTSDGKALTITASCGSAEGTANITVKRAPAAVAAVKLFRGDKELGANDTVVMPVGDAAEKTYVYTAKVYDQYGEEMEGTTATWEAATIAGTNNVTFDTESGTLTVQKGATKDGTATLKATSSGKEASVIVKITDVEVDWSNVKANTNVIYGTTNKGAVTIPSTGTATAGETPLAGTFKVEEETAIQGVGSKTVNVTFTVTSEGDYKGVTVTNAIEVNIAARPITVTVQNATREYGKANPEFSFKVTSGNLVNGDQESALGVTYTCDATESTEVSKVDITGTASCDNYTVTVNKGTLTITKATISKVETTATDKTLKANANENSDLEALTAYMGLPTEATVTYGDSKATALPITWKADKAFVQKGTKYTFTGTVTVGDNFNNTTMTAAAELTVTPVKVTAIDTVPATLTISKAQATAADASLTTLGLPEKVTLTYDSEVTAQEVTATYDKDIAAVKTVANQVTAAADKKVDVTLTQACLPGWATLDTTLPKAAITITNKYVIPEEDITFNAINTTFGAGYTPEATVTDKPEYEGVEYTYAYVDKDGKTVAEPVNAGTYTMTVTVENDNYKGTKNAELTISPKDVSGVTITLPENYSATYTGAALTPTVTVKDGTDTPASGTEGTDDYQPAVPAPVLKLNTDYTVAYTDNVNAGEATITVTGKGNYTGEKTATFNIEQASIAALKPTITGTAKAGQVLSAAVSGVIDSPNQVTWQWYTVTPAADAENEPTYTAISGATSASYTVVPNDSNLAIVVKATAKTNGNYKEETQASQSITVAKFTIYGTPMIQEQNKTDGVEGTIETGDTLSVTGYIEPSAARVGSTWQWYRNGEAIENAGGTVQESPAADMSYTVVEADAGATLKFVWTGNENFTGTVEGEVVVGKAMLTGTAKIVKGEDTAELKTAAVGDELKVLLDDAPENATYDVVWCYGDTPISGVAGETYTVTAADRGKNIHVQVMGTGNFTGELRGSYVSVPATVPGAPKVSASAGNGQVTVSWTAPADNGGSPITGYQVQQGSSGTPISVSAAATSYTFTDLTNGTEYTFTVKATNAIGDSAASEVKATPAVPTPSSGSNAGTPSAGKTEVSTGSDGAVNATVAATENKDGSYTAAISSSDAKKLEDAAKKSETGSSVVIEPDVKEDAGKVTVTVPTSTIAGVADSPAKDVVVKTPVADVVLGEDALKDLGSKSDKTVSITAEQKQDGNVSISVSAGSKTLDSVNGGLTAKIPTQEATSGTVAILVKPDGEEKIIRNSVVVDGELVVPLDGSATVKLVDNSKDFEDMTNHWAGDNVDFVSARELFQGTSSATFSPDTEMTRGMVATVLFRLDGEHKSNVSASFQDVASGNWYTDAVAWAAEKEIVTGYSQDLFAPNDNVTREQLVVMIYRYAKELGLDISANSNAAESFADSGKISSWAGTAMDWAVEAKLIQGKGNGILDPNGTATRAEVAAILERFVEFSVK